jgi:hypothetical protein
MHGPKYGIDLIYICSFVVHSVGCVRVHVRRRGNTMIKLSMNLKVQATEWALRERGEDIIDLQWRVCFEINHIDEIFAGTLSHLLIH